MNTYRYCKKYKNGYTVHATLTRYPKFCAGFIISDMYTIGYNHAKEQAIPKPLDADLYKDFMEWVDDEDNFNRKKWLTLADNKMNKPFCPNGLAKWLVKKKKWKLMNNEGSITSGITGMKVAIWTFARKRIGTKTPGAANPWG